MCTYISELGGVHYFYKKAKPEQETLVFLVAFGGDSTYFNFKNIIDKLESQYGILAIDSIGYGKSTTQQMERTTENVIKNYVDIIDYLHIQNLIFVGHSLGAVYSLALAEKIDPTRILLIEPPHIGIMSVLQTENQAFKEQVSMLTPMMASGEVVASDFIETTNPCNDEKLRVENSHLFYKNFGNPSILTEIEHMEDTVSLTSHVSEKILAKTILLCTLARKTEYEQSVFKSAREIHYLDGTHYLHWSNPKEVLAIFEK